jgi:hypothetical protein
VGKRLPQKLMDNILNTIFVELSKKVAGRLFL